MLQNLSNLFIKRKYDQHHLQVVIRHILQIYDAVFKWRQDLCRDVASKPSKVREPLVISGLVTAQIAVAFKASQVPVLVLN